MQPLHLVEASHSRLMKPGCKNRSCGRLDGGLHRRCHDDAKLTLDETAQLTPGTVGLFGPELARHLIGDAAEDPLAKLAVEFFNRLWKLDISRVRS